MKYLLLTCLALLTSILASCENADRSGVTLTQKPSAPGLQPPLTTSNEPVSVISATAKCLAVYEPDFFNSNEGSKVQTVDCVANSTFQNWLFTQQREILSDNGQCLAPAGVPEDGTLVVLNDCNGAKDQKWVLDKEALTIRHASDLNLCLEMPRLTIQFNGSPVVLTSCHGEENQQWIAQKLIHKQLTNALNPELSISMEPESAPQQLAAARNVGDWLGAVWILEPIGNFYRIRSQWKTDRFLHIERGVLEAGTISPYWDSAIWMFIRQDDHQGEAYLLRNIRLNNIYLGLDTNQNLKVGTIAELTEGSALWRAIDVNQAF